LPSILLPQDVFQTHDGEQLRRMLTRDDRLVSRHQIQAAHGDKKFRAVGKYLYLRPLRESFYDFQLNHLLWLLGEDWFDAEIAKPLPERHVILRWRDSRNQQLRKYQDPNDPDVLVRAPVTGEMRALQVLADDLYQLAHALEPPRAILARLTPGGENIWARAEDTRFPVSRDTLDLSFEALRCAPLIAANVVIFSRP
jgi:hypothetical protein